MDPKRTKEVLEPALKRLIAEEPAITKFDSVVGDGDCGVGLQRGAEAILAAISSWSSSDVVEFFDVICPTIEKSMDGTSGALYAIFFNALASNLRNLDKFTSSTPVDHKMWTEALQASLEDLSTYTPAQPGDRTLIDALVPFVNELADTGDTKKAAKAAEDGANKTKGMKASLGRSVYVGGKGFEEVPDPGAYGLSIFLNGIADAV